MWLEAARTGTAASRAPPVPPPGGAAVSSAHTLGIPPPTYKKTVPGQAGARKTVSVPAVMSAGTFLAYIEAV